MVEADDSPGKGGPDEGGPGEDSSGDDRTTENEGGNHDGASASALDGVQIDMISGERMDGLTSMEKIRLILDGVHEGNIVILEEGLDPDEESKLIEVTMAEINPAEFAGIEIETYPGSERSDAGFLDRLLGRERRTKLTVIGPANRLETLHKDETIISTLVTRQ